MQSGTTSAAFVAELETASRLVHTQSLQQAQLLEGLEHALSQLSEHRLLIQNPQPAAAPGSQQQEQRAGTTLMLMLCAGPAAVATRFRIGPQVKQQNPVALAQTSFPEYAPPAKLFWVSLLCCSYQMSP